MKSWNLALGVALMTLSAPAAAQPGPSPPAAPVGPPAAGTFVVHTIDVGTGLSIFVEGADFALLYDAGSNDDFARGANNRVLAYLRAVRPDLVTIDHLILSHPHKDHVEMIDDVLETYSVRNVWDSGSVNPTCGYRAFLEAIVAEPGVAYHNALGSGGTHNVTFPRSSCHGRTRPAGVVSVPRGSQISMFPVSLGAGAQMTILHANGTKRDPHLNDASVVARLDLGRRRILLTGDAEAGGRSPPSTAPRPASVEGMLLACCAAGLRSDILFAGHHGSMTSSRTAFLDAVGARDFIVSAGPKEYSGTALPDQVIIDELDRRGNVWRTDLNDATCGTRPAKIGRDNDGKPGGCDNVRIAINAAGSVTIAYDHRSD